MKKHFAIALAALLLAACSRPSGRKASLGPAEASYVLLSGGAAAYLSAAPKALNPEDILLVKVNPGTITISGRQIAMKEPYFIQTSPMKASQAQGYVSIQPVSDAPLTSLTLDGIEALLAAASRKSGLLLALPTPDQWDYAFLSGRIPQEDQPMVWEWTRDKITGKATWRGAVWHVMDLTPEEDPLRDSSRTQGNLTFRLAISL